MSLLSTLEALLTPTDESFIKTLYVDDGIAYYETQLKNKSIPIIQDRSLNTVEPDTMAYIRKYTKDNIDALKDEMCLNRQETIVQYIRAEKNEIRLLGLYLRLRDLNHP